MGGRCLGTGRWPLSGTGPVATAWDRVGGRCLGLGARQGPRNTFMPMSTSRHTPHAALLQSGQVPIVHAP
eukprot:360741-Chlamydomonas_euryale.AAC.3